MAIRHSTYIDHLTTVPEMTVSSQRLEDVVTVLQFRFVAKDTETGRTVQQTRSLHLDPPDPDRFIKYHELTHDQAMGWIRKYLDTKAVTDSLENQLETVTSRARRERHRPPWD